MKINIAQATPFNKWAVESELRSLFTAGVISFEEFVNSLDENSMLPKNKLLSIIETRGKEAQKDEIIKKLIEIISHYKMNDVANGIDGQTMPMPPIENEGEIQNV